MGRKPANYYTLLGNRRGPSCGYVRAISTSSLSELRTKDDAQELLHMTGNGGATRNAPCTVPSREYRQPAPFTSRSKKKTARTLALKMGR